MIVTGSKFFRLLFSFWCFKLSPACVRVLLSVSRFYKGLYITLVVSPWPFQCFYDLIAYVLSFDAVISHLGP